MMQRFLNSRAQVFGAALLVTLAAPALAQEKAAGDGAAAKPQSAWVKLCEKVPLVKKDKDGKDEKVEKSLCMTHHERIDGNSGLTLVSVALREIEGAEKKSLMVMVPLGMALPAKVKSVIFTTEQWAKLGKKETIDEKELKPFTLDYELCHVGGCTAEVEATAEMVTQLEKGGGLRVFTVNSNRQPVLFEVPLTGFTAAHAGEPVDSEKYNKARADMFAQIRERQKKAYETYKAEQETKGGEGGAAAAAEKK